MGCRAGQVTAAAQADPALSGSGSGLARRAAAGRDRRRQALTADLLSATEGRAVLFITHERDGLDQVDQIVVLDRGRVAEQGSHHQLRHAGGYYQRMRESEYEAPASQSVIANGQDGSF